MRLKAGSCSVESRREPRIAPKSKASSTTIRRTKPARFRKPHPMASVADLTIGRAFSGRESAATLPIYLRSTDSCDPCDFALLQSSASRMTSALSFVERQVNSAHIGVCGTGSQRRQIEAAGVVKQISQKHKTPVLNLPGPAVFATGSQVRPSVSCSASCDLPERNQANRYTSFK